MLMVVFYHIIGDDYFFITFHRKSAEKGAGG